MKTKAPVIDVVIDGRDRAPEMGPALPDAAAFNRALQARLRRLRERASLTQTDVAEALGMPSRSYQHFEARSPLPAYLIPAFAEIVGCSIEDVFHGHDC
jgi:DNA-binding XRE family transcriptional regulator